MQRRPVATASTIPNIFLPFFAKQAAQEEEERVVGVVGDSRKGSESADAVLLPVA